MLTAEILAVILLAAITWELVCISRAIQGVAAELSTARWENGQRLQVERDR